MNTTKPSIFKRGLVYFLDGLFLCMIASFFVSYFCIEIYNPTAPNPETGHIYLQNLKGAKVYLTKFQVYWVDYGMFTPFLPFSIRAYLDNRWGKNSNL